VGSLDTEPAQVDVGTAESITYPWDTTNYCLASGDTTISKPSVALTDMSVSPPQPVTLSDAPEIEGLRILQKIKGSELTAGHYYVAIVTFTGNQSSDVMSMRTRINCPF
jgi:hypothetical protein